MINSYSEVTDESLKTLFMTRIEKLIDLTPYDFSIKAVKYKFTPPELETAFTEWLKIASKPGTDHSNRSYNTKDLPDLVTAITNLGANDYHLSQDFFRFILDSCKDEKWRATFFPSNDSINNFFNFLVSKKDPVFTQMALAFSFFFLQPHLGVKFSNLHDVLLNFLQDASPDEIAGFAVLEADMYKDGNQNNIILYSLERELERSVELSRFSIINPNLERISNLFFNFWEKLSRKQQNDVLRSLFHNLPNNAMNLRTQLLSFLLENKNFEKSFIDFVKGIDSTDSNFPLYIKTIDEHLSKPKTGALETEESERLLLLNDFKSSLTWFEYKLVNTTKAEDVLDLLNERIHLNSNTDFNTGDYLENVVNPILIKHQKDFPLVRSAIAKMREDLTYQKLANEINGNPEKFKETAKAHPEIKWHYFKAKNKAPKTTPSVEEHQRTKTCLICCNDKDARESLRTCGNPDCDYRICTECKQRDFEFHYKNHGQDIEKCPVCHQEKFYDLNDPDLHLDSDLALSFERRNLRLYHQLIFPESKQCTTPNCINRISKEEEDNGFCSSCLSPLCIFCGGSHSTTECNNSDLSLSFTKLRLDPLSAYRPCPHCLGLTEKSEACDHMHCLRKIGGCGHVWNWVTGKNYRRYEITYASRKNNVPRSYRVKGDIKGRDPITGLLTFYQDGEYEENVKYDPSLYQNIDQDVRNYIKALKVQQQQKKQE